MCNLEVLFTTMTKTNDNINKVAVALGLGFFDCVHVGHRRVFDTLINFARTNDCLSACMSFSDNPVSKQKLVYDLDDRKRLMVQSGLDFVCAFEFEKIKELSALDFLNYCLDLFDLKFVACGKDFRFGKDALGDTALLQKFCQQHNIECHVVDTLLVDDKKVSSSLIKELLDSGEIGQANELLGSPYSISGVVAHGKGIGHTIVPTINILPKLHNQQLLSGVYGTYTLLDETWYRSVTNIGSQPTVDCEQSFVETHILNFSGDLYGKFVTVRFEKRLRSIVKFDNIEALKRQIDKDKEWI